ncbi:MAG: NRDE family protein [Flavobacteriales bacterium]|nr:NRDE family protein [Flavobacteriales bacterium]
MCLIAFAYKVHPEFPLIVVANRDEFLDRPTEPARFWPAEPHILAGRDRKAGGTWMGITTSGRFAAVTNYRDLRLPRVEGPSRGILVRQAMEAGFAPENSERYEGFNLLYGTIDRLMYHSNVNVETLDLPPGVHGLSNHLLNTPWPKVVRAKSRLTELLAAELQVRDLFDLLADRTRAADPDLPDTGLDLGRERALSSIRIEMDGYGTRCSTVVLVDRTGAVTFEERVIQPPSVGRFEFSIP